MASALQQASVATITICRNWALNGSLACGAAIEAIEVLAPAADVVSGPQALLSAVKTVGWQAQYQNALGYYERALTNAQIGSV